MSVDLVFDLDGTISNPELGIRRSINFALVQQGFAPVPDERVARWIGPPLEAALADLSGTDDEVTIAALVGSYRERYGQLGYAENVLYEGIPDALNALADSGLKLGVCTSKRRDFAVKILELFGLRDLFEFVSGGDVGVTKESQLSKLKKDGAIGDDAVMIGDRAVDIVAATANGLASAGVAWGFGVDGELTAAGAEVILEQPPELLRFARNGS